MPYTLEPLVREAVSGFGGWPDGYFNVAHFQHAVRAEFGLAAFPDSAWCAAVLNKLEYVKRLEDGSHWRYCRPVGLPSR